MPDLRTQYEVLLEIKDILENYDEGYNLVRNSKLWEEEEWEDYSHLLV